MDSVAQDVTLLFLAVSVADRRILEEEVFIMEKCSRDYGISLEEWEAALNRSFITYFNEGDTAISNAIYRLSKALDQEKKRELTEDLLAIALADDIFHEKEKIVIRIVCRAFGVHLKVPREFGIVCD
ncbi:MAG: TerB family tellurite resistance protein [Candidatus Thermoplasmatota archaeon]|nr:TerB family tellurite resistance protein [Candidatus Thermoplasmatota archaeon]